MPDKKTRGISNLPVAIPDVPDAPTVSASNVGTSRAYNNGAATVTITSPTGGLPSSYSITTTPTTTTTVATGSTTITGLSSATSYTATVTPSNVSATGPATTSSSFTATTVPATPSAPTATNAGSGRAYNNGSASVAFTAPATGGSAITGYTVTSSPGSFTGTGASSPITVTGQQSAVAYTYTITATNANGASASSSASASVTATTVPQAPTIGTATAGASSASVTFTAGATGGSAITGYTVTSSPGSFTGTGASSPITVSGLTNGTAYTFTVTATNANGTSASSSASNSATPVEPYWLILERYGSVGSVYGRAVAVDTSGNAYTTARGDNNVFHVFKYNSTGTNQWKYTLGAAGDTYASLATDSSGNVYVGGSGVTGSADNKDMFAGKYTTDFSQVWGKRQYTSSDDQGYGVSVDSSGNVYSVGVSYWSGGQGMVAKYNSSGTLQWKRYFGAGNSDEYRSVGTDSSGNVYAAGNGTQSLSCGYIAKYDSSGTLQWQRQLTDSTYNVYLKASTTNSSGATTVVGQWQPNANRSNDAFIAQYNSSGGLSWQSQLFGPTNSYTQGFSSVAEDSSGNVYACGWRFNGSVTQLLIAKYDSSGTLQWQRTMQLTSSGSFANQNNTGIAINGASMYVTTEVYDLNNSGQYSGFVAKLPTDGTKTGTLTFSTLGQTVTYAAGNSTVSAGGGPTSGAASYWTTGTETTAADGTLSPGSNSSTLSLTTVSI